MILVFDIGNTNIKTALVENEKVLHQWRISTDAKRTGDEYFSIL
ncbi:MAG: type III pantothenate kinase, partial [Treponema porcinum]|nr:type III pantothenate kinase [Treponema porcinum]